MFDLFVPLTRLGSVDFEVDIRSWYRVGFGSFVLLAHLQSSALPFPVRLGLASFEDEIVFDSTVLLARLEPSGSEADIRLGY